MNAPNRSLAAGLLACVAAAGWAQDPAGPPARRSRPERLRAEARRIYAAVFSAASNRVAAGPPAQPPAPASADAGRDLLDAYFRAAFVAASATAPTSSPTGAATAESSPPPAPADRLLSAQAALLALALFTDPHSTLLATPLAGALLAGIEDAAQRAQKKSLCGTPTVRGRNDWVRHFLVSAALTVLLGEALARSAGVQKEVADAHALSAGHGTGFSFGDLCADEAGIRFAAWLAADPDRTAARVPVWATAFSAADFFPEAKDLPEDLPWEEFVARFGGVGAPEYEKVRAEIRRRVETCPGYH